MWHRSFTCKATAGTDTFLLENICPFQVYSLLAKGPTSFLHHSLYYGSFALFMEPSFPLTQDPDYTPLPTAFQVFNLWDMISGLCAAPLNLTFSGTRHLTSCSTWVLRIDQPSMPQLISRHQRKKEEWVLPSQFTGKGRNCLSKTTREHVASNPSPRIRFKSIPCTTFCFKNKQKHKL